MYISYTDLANIISECGTKEDSDRGPVTEIIGPQIFFTPGLLINRQGMNKRLAMLEAAMFMAGIFDIERIKDVAPRANYDLYQFQSDYGPRTEGQMRNMIGELDIVKNSRKGILHFQSVKYTKSSAVNYFKDLACTTSMQFLIRGNQLNVITTMRSCDFVYGFPMDIFMFGMFSQFVASLFPDITKINCCVQIGSLHIYESTAHLAKEDAMPEFVSLIEHSQLRKDADWTGKNSPFLRYYYLKEMFKDVANDGALNFKSTWEDYKQICAWPFEFSRLESSTQLEVP